MDVVKYQMVEKANTGLHSKKNIEKYREKINIGAIWGANKNTKRQEIQMWDKNFKCRIK